MKKLTKVTFVLMMALCLMFVTACGKTDSGDGSTPSISTDFKLFDQYEDYKLSESVVLPDYLSYDVEVPTVTISDEEIDDEIAERLTQGGTVEEVTEGVCEEGDTVKVDFAGTLEDGTTDDGMTGTDTQLEVGGAGFIEGFTESLIGAKVGETVTADLTFPEPYDAKPEYAGKGVTFEITVKAKLVEKPAEFNEEFIKKDTEEKAKNEEEYRAFIKDKLESVALADAIYEKKTEIYNKIVEETTDVTVIEEKVTEYCEMMNATYEKMATAYGMDMEAFRAQYFDMDEETFAEFLQEYAQSVVKSRMVIYALAQAEDVSVTKEDYSSYLANLMVYSGFTSEADFEEAYGVTVEEYADGYNALANLSLDKSLEKIYEKITA